MWYGGDNTRCVIAAFCLPVLPALLMPREVAEYRILLFGILIVVMMISKPRGLFRVTRNGFASRAGTVK